MVPSYNAQEDVLRLELNQGQVAREEVLSQHIHASYTDQSELVAITVRSARVDSSRILATALYAVGQVGIQQVDSLMLIVAAVMLRYFGAIPALGALPETHRNDAGYFVESVARTLLTADLAEAVLGAIEPFKPIALDDQLAVDWQATGSLLLRDAQHPALEYVRTKKFDSLMQHALSRDNAYRLRVEAAADQLHALATAKTDAYRQAQLASIDWQLVADEFASVAGRYAGSVERYASRAIANLAEKLITYRDSVDLGLAMSDLEAHLVDFDPSEVDDDDIAQAWENSVDELDIARGIVRNIEPIRTLEALRVAAGEKLAVHRKLDQKSAAYRAGWSVLYTDQAIDDLLWVESLPMDEKVDALLAAVTAEWKKTSLVLVRVALTLNRTVSEAVLAELSRAISVAAEAGRIEVSGDIDLWDASELRSVQ